MSRVFLSILGTGNYEECTYTYGGQSKRTRFVQEAILDIYAKNGFNFDKIIVFTTEKSQKTNWEDKESERLLSIKSTIKRGCDEETFNRIEEILRGQAVWEGGLKELESAKPGLRSILESKYHEIAESRRVPDGKSEEEIWDIFRAIDEVIGQNDEIVFDITHSFRSIPMLALTVLNYAKVLKNIKVKGVHYGAYDFDGAEEYPIVDLTNYDEILSWSFAANAFMKYGSSKEIVSVYEEFDYKEERLRLAIEAINDFTNCIKAGRGKILKNDANIKIKETDFYSLKSKSSTDAAYRSTIHRLESLKAGNLEKVRPLLPLFEKIRAEIEGFDYGNDYELGMKMVEWCIENEMTQQGLTALDETIKTYICIKSKLDLNDIDIRFHTLKEVMNGISRGESRASIEEAIKEKNRQKRRNKASNINKAAKAILDYLPDELAKLSIKATRKRNDMNHFGFTRETEDYGSLHSELVELYEEMKKYGD